MANSSIIRKAIQSGSYDEIKQVIETVPYQVLSETGYTPLMLAIHLGPTTVHKKEFQLLLDWEPDLNRKDVDGYSAFSYAMSLHRIEFINALIDRNVDVNVPCVTTIAPHLRAYDAYRMDVMLDKRTKYPVSTRHQMSPLSMAIYRSYDYLVPELVERGADLDVIGGLDITPLSMAVRSHNFEMVEYLLEKGANPNVLPSNWHEYASNPDEVCPVALKKAIKYGEAMALNMLIQAGSNVPRLFPRKNDLYSTPLTYLFSQPVSQLNEQFSCFEILRQYSSIKELDSMGRSPLSHALENKTLDYTLYYLMDEEINNKPDINGMTPMMYAFRSGHYRGMELLQAQGVSMADQILPDTRRNLLMDAVHHLNPEMVSFLLQHEPKLLQMAKGAKNLAEHITHQNSPIASLMFEILQKQK